MKVIELGFELTKKFEKVLIPIGTKIAVEIMLPSCQINELTTIADIKEARGIFRLLKYQYVAISPPIDLGVMVCTTIPIIVPTKISLHLTLSPCSVITRLKIRAWKIESNKCTKWKKYKWSSSNITSICRSGKFCNIILDI